jgi:hypothetical protein
MYTKGNSLTSHRISGSFHWELQLNGFFYGGFAYRSNITRVLFDTGANGMFMPYESWWLIFNLVCLDLPVGSECI